MKHECPKCPYVVGNKSTLQLGVPYNDEIVEARITQVFEPFTLARVMVVQLNSPALGLSGNMVLKVFDQRFASQTRENEKADPWTLDIGKQYEDEEGAVAFVMHKYLQEGFVYNRSALYEKLDEYYMMGD